MSRRRGVALIIVLALIVLVSGIVLAFFSRAINDSQVSGSSATTARTDLFLQGAIDSTVGDLKQEIVSGSTQSGTLYAPNDSTTLLPSVQADAPTGQNLVARSSYSTPLYSGNYTNAATDRAAQNAATTNASLNGRSVTPARWNKPLFLPAKSDTDLTPDPGTVNFKAPDWVLVARNGSNPGSKATTSVSGIADQTGDGFVTGRYAYTIYNEGALLDLNTVGYPNSGGTDTTKASVPSNGMSIEQLSRKGSPVLSDLTQVYLTPAQINTILAWRNNASLQASSGTPKGGMSAGGTGFYDLVTKGGFVNNNSLGLLNVVPTSMSTDGKQTDQAFRGRQDLIRMTSLGMCGSSAERVKMQSVLRQTSMFSREVNTASPMALNGSVAVQTPFTRLDGTTAQVGEPLLKRRFPLNRIALLSDPAKNAAAIKQYFGLVAGPGGTWNYNPGTGTVAAGLPTITSLDNVSKAGREPNFFELLNAAILPGSLGASHNLNAFFNTAQDANKNRDIFQIGLNIIDQYDEDDEPTVLTLGSPAPYISADISNTLPISGVESLPYPLLAGLQTFKDSTQDAGAGKSYYEAYQQWVLWNPHKNPTVHAASSLQSFRIRVNGEAYATYTIGSTKGDTSATPHTFTNECVYFSTKSNAFSPMTPLAPNDTDLTASAAQDRFPRGNTSPGSIAFFIGEFKAPSSGSMDLRHAYNQPLTYSFEKLDTHNNWLPYCTLPRLARPYGDNGAPPNGLDNVAASMRGVKFYANITSSHPDPRTVRFGMSQGGSGVGSDLANNAYVPQDLIKTGGASISEGSIVDQDTTPAMTVVPPFPNNAMTGADLAYNSTANTLYYKDPDGKVRKADGNSVLPSTRRTGSPYTFGEANPTVLNRAFTSVAEMGYASRGSPWRSLNFYSNDSADTALLDYFTINETSDLRAGTVDINNVSTPVLTAILAGAYHKPNDTTAANYASIASCSSIATLVSKYLHPTTGVRPVLKNNGDIALMIDSVNLVSPGFNVDLKFDREMLVRALVPASNTRTWNLLIDVIAQTGRYPSNAAGNDPNRFKVDGERRAWVHLAIDRFTGKVVGKQIEYVNE